jgi:hypothetical protein
METLMNGWYEFIPVQIIYHAPSTVLRNVYWVLVAGRTMHNIDSSWWTLMILLFTSWSNGVKRYTVTIMVVMYHNCSVNLGFSLSSSAWCYWTLPVLLCLLGTCCWQNYAQYWLKLTVVVLLFTSWSNGVKRYTVEFCLMLLNEVCHPSSSSKIF